MWTVQIYKNPLGKGAVEGESPVLKKFVLPTSILSRAGSETPCLNPAAPSAKAKYY